MRNNPNTPAMATNTTANGSRKGRMPNPRALNNIGAAIFNPITQKEVAFCRYYAMKKDGIHLDELERNSWIDHPDFNGTLSTLEWMDKYQPVDDRLNPEIQRASESPEFTNDDLDTTSNNSKQVFSYKDLISELVVSRIETTTERELRKKVEFVLEQARAELSEMQETLKKVMVATRSFAERIEILPYGEPREELPF